MQLRTPVVLVRATRISKAAGCSASGQAADLQAEPNITFAWTQPGPAAIHQLLPAKRVDCEFQEKAIVNGLSTDFNRPTQDSIPGALNVRLTCAGQPSNDQQPQTIPLTAHYASNGNCDSRSVYYGYGIQDNSLARAAASHAGGAGKSLFWRSNPPSTGCYRSMLPTVLPGPDPGGEHRTDICHQPVSIIVQAAREVVLGDRQRRGNHRSSWPRPRKMQRDRTTTCSAGA